MIMIMIMIMIYDLSIIFRWIAGMAKKYGAIVNLDLGYTGLVVCGNNETDPNLSSLL